MTPITTIVIPVRISLEEIMKLVTKYVSLGFSVLAITYVENNLINGTIQTKQTKPSNTI